MKRCRATPKPLTSWLSMQGRTGAAEEDIRNKEADTELKKARKQAVTGENETDEALEKLDAILKEVRDNAVEQNAE